MIDLSARKKPICRIATVAVVAVTALGAAAIPAAAAPQLSKKQVHSLKQACGYFSSDYAGLVGGLKMSNLTGSELRSAARYVASDLEAVEPPLDAKKKDQLSQARKVLTRVAASTPQRPVSTSEKDRLNKTFQSTPFSTLTKAVRTACRYLSGGKSG